MANPIAFIKRPAHIAAALLFGFALVVPVVLSATSQAAQLQSRSIQLANSATGATGVSYTVTFNVAQTATIKGIVVDICSGNTSPLIGTACSQPTSFTWGGSPSITSATINATDISTWTWASANGGRTLTATDATGVAATSGQTVTIVVASVANPSDVDVVTGGNQVGTFYGRMITYSDNTEVTNYDPTDGEATTGYLDVGGAAMSTTNNLTVTARVQENIRFCLYTNGPAQNCATGTGSAIDIPNATTPLSSSSVSTASAYFNLSSNALSGVNIRMWSNNGNEGVLTSGANTITAFGPAVDDACTADSTTSTVEQFGMRVAPSTAVTASAPYACAAGNHGWDADNTAGSGANDATTVGSAYGDTVATTAGANDEEESVLEFAAKSALTTEAGIYTTALNYIATGTY